MLTQGDARQVLCGPGWGGFDLLLTDPPYKLTEGGRTGSGMRGIFSPDKYDNSGNLFPTVPFEEWLPLAYDSLKTDADAYVMVNDKNVRAAMNAADDANFRFHNLLVWEKDTVTPNRWYMKKLEFTLYFYRGTARNINDMSSAQIMRAPNPDVTGHPTEKPVALMQHYIENSTRPGETVLDPFCGGGSTAVAAIRSGRKFVGIELQEEWFDVTVARIEHEIATRQESLEFV